MPHLPAKTLLITLMCTYAAQAETVFDTGEDLYAEDGPWIEIPADFDPAGPTAADIIAMADLDGDPMSLTDEERGMIAVLTMVLLAPSTPFSP